MTTGRPVTMSETRKSTEPGSPVATIKLKIRPPRVASTTSRRPPTSIRATGASIGSPVSRSQGPRWPVRRIVPTRPDSSP